MSSSGQRGLHLSPLRKQGPIRRALSMGWRVWVPAAGIACMLAMAAGWIISLGPPPLGANLTYSTLVVDREGRLLRPYTTAEGLWRLPATRADVDPRFFKLLFAYEDKRFAEHHGVDPWAVARAATQLVRNGRIVSGASTLSMQVARLLEPRTERSLMAKLRQMVRAIEIERSLSKDQILALYLSLAPYGGNLEGIRAASLAYFGKEPRRLTLAESRSWWRCRNRRSSAGPTGRGRRRRARATTCSIDWPPRVWCLPTRLRPPSAKACPTGAVRCRCWRRMRPMRSWRRRPGAACTASPSMLPCKAASRSLRASAPARSAPIFR